MTVPGLVRKFVIFASVEGLILQPLAQKDKRGPITPVRIAYGNCAIAPISKDDVEGEHSAKRFEAFGIVGLLTVSSSSFLITITRRRQVAQILGKPIYVATEVALTPLASRTEAESAIAQTQATLLKRADDDVQDHSDTDGEDEGSSAAINDEVDDDVHSPPAPVSTTEHHRTNSVAEDVITRRGGYGRFAQKWFSKKGWTDDQRRNLGMSGSETNINSKTDATAQSPVPAIEASSSDTEVKRNGSNKSRKPRDVAEDITPKLLRTTSILFGSSQSFYFSYEWDLTRNFATNNLVAMEAPNVAFFWNRHLSQPFSDAGQSAFVLPLIQGFVGQRAFQMDTNPPKPIFGVERANSSMEMEEWSTDAEQSDTQTDPNKASTEKSFLLTLISRRSVKRAGLRYLRRGIDEQGDTANTVETEQILSDASWEPSKNIHSFTQLRGSVPIYFSQTPYSFKPSPQLQHSEEANYQAFAKHFESLQKVYGDVQVASLVEQHGPEAIVSEAYEKYFNRLKEAGNSNVTAEFWDFHTLCKGMKFENVSLLLDLLSEKLDSFGHTVVVENRCLAKQKGVLRTNCMDCLDRTNVVQSACGRHALEKQLKIEGIDMSLQVDQVTQWYNDLWADNGDACSKAYASTAALKGDFTRTRKRDLQGALKDMGLSISRFYSGIVNDFFSQAAIDFLLGNVNQGVWEDFEANLMTSDPSVSMPKLRQQAIELCQKIVIADDAEEFIDGWTLLTPHAPNTIKSTPFEESVLLLTDAALYSCRFDWLTEKVSSFERVDLQHIASIKFGTYITSTLSTAQQDEERNVGFVITYQPGIDDITRVNSRAMSNIRPNDGPDLLQPTLGPKATDKSSAVTRVLALKALPTKTAVVGGDVPKLSELEQVKTICSEIERIILHGQVVEVGTERKSVLEAADIISLADARKSTGLLEQLGHSLKKLVWA